MHWPISDELFRLQIQNISSRSNFFDDVTRKIGALDFNFTNFWNWEKRVGCATWKVWFSNLVQLNDINWSIAWYKLHFLLSGFFMEDMGVWKKMAGKKIISAKCAIPKLRMSLDNCHSQIHFFFLTPVFYVGNLDVDCTYFPNKRKE